MRRVAGLVLACVPALLVACHHPGVQPWTGEVARSGQLVGAGSAYEIAQASASPTCSAGGEAQSSAGKVTR